MAWPASRASLPAGHSSLIASTFGPTAVGSDWLGSNRLGTVSYELKVPSSATFYRDKYMFYGPFLAFTSRARILWHGLPRYGAARHTDNFAN